MISSIIKNEKFKVFVRCNTYNQSKYIKDALNGFVIQKTNFPFVCMIMDDCSTDGEQQLLIEWMNSECDINNASIFDIVDARVFIVKHKSNSNCTFAFYLLTRNTWKEKNVKLEMYAPWRACCEYEAFCEGDDYWIDAKKLQKQVDILDEKQDFGLCYTDYNLLFQNSGNLIQDRFKSGLSKCPFEIKSLSDFIVNGGYYAPPSWLIRISLIPKDVIFPKSCDGTFVMLAYYYSITKLYALKDTTVTYRILEESAVHSKDYEKIYLRNLNLLNTRREMVSFFGLPNEVYTNCEIAYYKKNITNLVIHNKFKDIDKAKLLYYNKLSVKERVLITFAPYKIFRLLIGHLKK